MYALPNAPQLLYLSNCGIFLTCGNTRILLDGLHSDSSIFDRLPKTLERLIIDGGGPYSRVDFLIFTHLHFDHFDLEKTLRFMEGHPEATLVIPENITELLNSSEHDRNAVRAGAVLKGRTLLMKDTDNSGPISLSAGDVTLTWLRVNHITFDYPQHYCLLLSCGADDFLFTADVDFEQLSSLGDALDLQRRAHLTAFFNPILLGKPKWVEEAARWRPEKVFIYHIPAENIDSNGYRKLALNRALRCSAQLPQMELLLNSVQTL